MRQQPIRDEECPKLTNKRDNSKVYVDREKSRKSSPS